MITKYTNYIIESLKDKMYPKSDDDIINKINTYDKDKQIDTIIRFIRNKDEYNIILLLDNLKFHWTELSKILLNVVNYNLVEVTKKLLEIGIDLECTDILKNTPLIIASKNGNLDIVKLLVEHGANIEHTNENGYNAFMVAIMNNNSIVSSYLKKYKDNVKVS
jgi:ankyrin repeat protein